MGFTAVYKPPCRGCGHTWPAHRYTGTGACETCDCAAYWDPATGWFRAKVPASRPVRGSAGRDAGDPGPSR